MMERKSANNTFKNLDIRESEITAISGKSIIKTEGRKEILFWLRCASLRLKNYLGIL